MSDPSGAGSDMRGCDRCPCVMNREGEREDISLRSVQTDLEGL